MKFNSQICTTKEQSERLLALGLKKETADMMYCKTASGELITAKDDDYLEHLDIPAWTLHRLIEMLNYQVIHNGKKYEPIIAIDGMAYQDVCNDDPIVGWSGDLYTDVIDCIEWLIQEGYFNKEYIEHI
jgi:hypothetical protein